MTHKLLDTATPPPAHLKGAIHPWLSWWLLSILLILTLLIRLGFVFYGTDYANYLFSDCGGVDVTIDDDRNPHPRLEVGTQVRTFPSGLWR